jgi:hypothetical protein
MGVYSLFHGKKLEVCGVSYATLVSITRHLLGLGPSRESASSPKYNENDEVVNAWYGKVICRATNGPLTARPSRCVVGNTCKHVVLCFHSQAAKDATTTTPTTTLVYCPGVGFSPLSSFHTYPCCFPTHPIFEKRTKHLVGHIFGDL